MSNLNGKTAIVTGASKGIGAGIAKQLADMGASVALTYTSRGADAETILGSLKGSGHCVIQMDVANSDSVQAGVDQALERLGRIDGPDLCVGDDQIGCGS